MADKIFLTESFSLKETFLQERKRRQTTRQNFGPPDRAIIRRSDEKSLFLKIAHFELFLNCAFLSGLLRFSFEPGGFMALANELLPFL